MRLAAWLILVLAPATLAAQRTGALAIAREVERMGRRDYWPGYRPLAIPLAVYDGRRTWLFRHPSPPAGFSPVAGSRPAALAFDGRHPAVTSNSSAEIGGVATATVLADGPRSSLDAASLAAVAIHEAFHVFQRARHPGWSGNEGDLLLYPVDDGRLLGHRRLETEALRRAVTARARPESACWARTALEHRQKRFAGMDSVFGRYERLTELNEGLATYVQLLARRASVEFPAGEFAAAEIRDRIYVTGPALAMLLDRHSPGWHRPLEAADDQNLDSMLDAALPGTTACDFPAAQRLAVERQAQDDAGRVTSARQEQRRSFDARPGWRVVVRAAPGKPLWPQGFDPLNVGRVDGGLLHRRFLRLGNEAGELSAIDEAAVDLDVLTVAAGEHPLFNGIAEAVVAGLARPDVARDGASVRVRTAGLAIRFSNATVREAGDSVIVQIAGTK